MVSDDGTVHRYLGVVKDCSCEMQPYGRGVSSFLHNLLRANPPFFFFSFFFLSSWKPFPGKGGYGVEERYVIQVINV